MIKRAQTRVLAATSIRATHLLPARHSLPAPDIDLGPIWNGDADQRRFTPPLSVDEATHRSPSDSLLSRTSAGDGKPDVPLHLPTWQYTEESTENRG